MTSTSDITGRWKEYFLDFFNPTITSSIEDPESEFCLSTTGAEVSEVVKKLHDGRAPRVDEI